jgi:exodeoxyribonuclease V alpha subunit
MDEIFGHIERITFQNSENGYVVAQLQQSKSTTLTCIVGSMPMLHAGETVRCKGYWKQHPVHGKQFEVQEFQMIAPADLLGIKKYLGSGLIKGIGAAYAGRIVAKFGIQTLQILDENAERLKEVPGLGPKRIEKIKQCWAEQRSVRDVMIFLQRYGISPSFAQKIFKSYGNESIKKITENPYCLAKDVIGIGFKSADAIASKMGIEKESSKRIDSGVEYVLFELSNDGHVCYPIDLFTQEAEKILEVGSSLIASSLEHLNKEGRIKISSLEFEGEERSFVWVIALYSAENGISRELRRIKSGKSNLRSVDALKAVDWVQEQLNIKLASMQKDAVAQALTEKVQIITGGPGTGKSTITKAILAITAKLTKKILLAAPTGKAAKRMSEITGMYASTIHALLEYDFTAGGFKRNKESPLECDLLIIDEASMIDTLLMYYLLRAIPSNARLIFIGDINQLPSVGPGNVLRDLIDSKQIPVTMLTEIFRQAAGSRIITNAHRINNGIFPDINNYPTSDFFFIENQEPEEILSTIVELVSKRIPAKYNFNSLEDIQVLTPMRRSLIGIENLNTVLQESLNPTKEEPLIRGYTRFHINDKVMQIRNNYSKGVFNGDVGRIVDINKVDQEVTIAFDYKKVVYDFSELDEIVLAYAVSIHKYQGSECPCIVIPVHTSHFMMLHRNLLYTGVTRGRKLVVLVGTKKALAIAVKNDEVKKRYTGLQHWMKKYRIRN